MHRKSYEPAKVAHFDLPLPIFDEDDSPLDEKEDEFASPPQSNEFNPTIYDTSLPTLSNSGRIPRIMPAVYVGLVDNTIENDFNKIITIDCRYSYEYKGGHIKNAINANTTEILYKMLFSKVALTEFRHQKIALIFHCEFSKNRGPELAGYVREMDRTLNANNYPNLYYPEVYIIDGGYSTFYEAFPAYCDGGYTKMRDKFHRRSGDLNKSILKYRESMQQTKRRIRHNNENCDLNENATSPTSKVSGRKARNYISEDSPAVQVLDF
ncbi:Rhodanese-like domain containing protein [Tritrichomonas foetus]|uniref:protein-tyrosine-phosphatase n=1 Tax=Tritrichomonas foetus TaxID=1144522 RepID=A0A1J4K7C9_9EUKA|nr:Rhodanese-like domain containing protein [Tritrichomonas foetus]|eukprot:OHT05317.1 Rhodanese-like domain containing protein [Tritrichomonas foetus]